MPNSDDDGSPVRDDDSLARAFHGENQFLAGTFDDMTIIVPIKKLTLAGNVQAHTFDTSVEASHEDDAVRAVSYLLYWRYNEISDPKLRLLVVPGRFATKSPNHELLRKKMVNEWRPKMQGAIMKWFWVGVVNTCSQMGFKEAWASTNIKQRCAPGAIYSRTTNVRWQKSHKQSN